MYLGIVKICLLLYEKPIYGNYRNREIFMLLTAIITEAEEGGYIALNPETGTTTQGDTYEEAVSNLKDATRLYLEEFP
jgi:hypothetical protein